MKLYLHIPYGLNGIMLRNKGIFSSYPGLHGTYFGNHCPDRYKKIMYVFECNCRFCIHNLDFVLMVLKREIYQSMKLEQLVVV